MSSERLLKAIKENYTEWQQAQTKVEQIRQKIINRSGTDQVNAFEFATAAVHAQGLQLRRHALIFELMTTVSYWRFKKLASISGGPFI